MRVHQRGEERVVVLADHRDDTYVDARPAGKPGYSQIEFVRGGHRRFRQVIPTLRAPQRVLEIARGERL
jgi:2-C-methyl-D-erythritol 4-phosphate cytidylyltransferase